jgi:hypothetical protein
MFGESLSLIYFTCCINKSLYDQEIIMLIISVKKILTVLTDCEDVGRSLKSYSKLPDILCLSIQNSHPAGSNLKGNLPFL